MNDSLISTIQAFTLNARHRLEREADEQLQGLYGWLPDGSFARADLYPAIKTVPEARETRARLEQFAAEEKEAGFSAPDARKKLLRETAFTWLNRFVAFRMMEERKIIKQTIAKQADSRAFKFWLVEDANAAAYVEFQKGDMPKNDMDEGPSQTAYRQFLLAQCDQLAAEVSVLFDPATLASRLCPRPAVLKQLAEAMNAAELVEAWQAGNEETIGWVYQGFSAEELKAAFTAAKQDKKKFEPEDIPAVTQLFTIRWVVRFLVENTLGRIWVEIHPDSRMAKSLGYLVPPKHPQQRALRQVKDITFLDPCCGSMHFGLLAFDLFAEMYREERENTGKPGWPDTPSAATDEEIPELILAHNLHGIDIDTRAVQLSALTLFLKARMLNPKARVTDTNLATANIEQLTGGRLEEFISQTQFSHPIYERILRRLADRVKDSPHLGSLLRLEKDIKQLVDAERQRSGELLDQLPGIHPEQFDTEEGVEEFFDILTDQILRHLDHFVQATRAEGQDAGLFAREAAKGLRFLSLIDQRYDVVTTNPPYLSGRKMNKRLSTLMEQEYNEGKGDLYAAFIMRCQELLAPEGLMGMLTMHSFMFISSYEDLRSLLRKEVAIETLAHYGGGLFAVGNPGTLQTAAFVLRREPAAPRRDGQVGTYFRLVKERDADAKRLAFESALDALREGDDHPHYSHYQQADFDAIPGYPFVYWLPKRIREIFRTTDTIGDSHYACRGIQTSDNPRFIRFWWEVGEFSVALPDSTDPSSLKWVPYMKGGPLVRWYGNQEHVLNWAGSGAELYAFRPKSVIRNANLMGSEGVTFSTITSGPIGFRYMPKGFFWDQSGSALIRKSGIISSDLIILNSLATVAFARLVAPTINYTIGDIAKIPFRQPDEEFLIEASPIVEEAIRLAKQASAETETTRDFRNPAINASLSQVRTKALKSCNDQADDLAAKFYGLDKHELEELERELSAAIKAESDKEVVEEEDADEAAADLSPADWARSWTSYALGTVLGRFKIGKPGGLGCGDFPEATVAEIRKLIDPDGIMICEAGHPQDIATRAVACLELMLGAAEARERIRLATDSAGDPVDALRGWLNRFTGTPDKSFWKYHIEKKRYWGCPVYWPFQSPDKSFTVWVFQERFTKDTLFKMRQEFVDPRLNRLRSQLDEKRATARTSAGKEKRDAEKAASALAEELEDVEEFSKRLTAILARGYTPCIDDGVLLNAAPLWELLPSWPETKKAWKELEDEKYEWAHQAMHHWPDRVKKACQTNKSFAIAHGLA